MEPIYLCIVVFLLCLAVFDLFVGVSNDAVNFLNSAIGAKVAKFRTVLIVASAGVAIGAVMSSGMMDVARHGIMQPSNFSFYDVMTIFLAVMVTDIIVLDMFNTLGMPTSTTVSLVFELLGGTFILAVLKVSADPNLAFGDLLNTDKALSVIIAIFVSVAIAFVFGIIVQWLSRIVFTFNYKRHSRYSIAIFGGIAFTALAYFIFLKGIAKSHYIAEDVRTWVEANTQMLLLATFVGSSIVMEVLHMLRINIFRLIVLMGTFALAMAFAGNDLVNFIGVPLAGLDSYNDYVANSGGVGVSHFMMHSLNGSAQTPPVYLFAAGVVMIVAMATSKKAQNVIKTSVDLARQDEGDEMFGSSRAARSIVRVTQESSSWISQYMPKSLARWIDSRFNKEEAELNEGAAFDVVRAAINLVLASLLITVGTNYKLPLSTTYVTFMVAMGSSLADRAWSRESAVFRVTGVISVIGGWFITAGAAFIMSFTIATLNHFGGFVAMLILIGILAAVLINNNKKFNKQQEENVDTLFRQLVRCHDKQQTWQLLIKHVSQTQSELIDFAQKALNGIVNGMMNEDVRSLRQASHAIEDEKGKWKRYRRKEILGMRKIDYMLAVEKNTWFHLGCNNCTQIIYCLKRMLEPVMEHVDNNFNPLPDNYKSELDPLLNDVCNYLERTKGMISSGDFNTADELLVEGNAIKSRISQIRHQQQDRMQREDSNIKVSLLYLNTLQEMQELVSMMRHLLRASKRFQIG